MVAERLQKLIAAAGITSRRKAEELIVAGQVAVNGVTILDLGTRADPDVDEVRVKGRPLPRPTRIYLALNKPVGVVSSLADPHADSVVTDLLGPDIRERVYPAGRLDRDSEGLMLLTNDGALMNAVTRPGGGVEKVYRVEVAGRPDAQQLDAVAGGPRACGPQATAVPNRSPRLDRARQRSWCHLARGEEEPDPAHVPRHSAPGPAAGQGHASGPSAWVTCPPGPIGILRWRNWTSSATVQAW